MIDEVEKHLKEKSKDKQANLNTVTEIEKV